MVQTLVNGVLVYTFPQNTAVFSGAGTGKATVVYANSSNNVTFTLPAITGTAAVIGSASTFLTVGNPTGTSSSTAVMMGLGSTFVFTPTTTGIIKVTMDANVSNGTNATEPVFGMNYGTGIAPTNGSALTGTAIGIARAIQIITALSTTGQVVSLHGIITGAALNTQIWIDATLYSLGGAGTSTLQGATVLIEELPY